MRIFSNATTTTQSTTTSSSPKKAGHREVERETIIEKVDYESKIMKDPRMKKYSKPAISDSEVRVKLTKHIEKLAAEKALADIARAKRVQAKKAQMVKSGEAGAPEIEKPVVGDVSLNDPTDSNTREKLKEAVTMGSFNFSAKERQVLNKILGKE